MVHLQCKIELKHIFGTWDSKMDFYNNYTTKEKFSNLKNQAHKGFGSTYTYK